MDFNRPVRDGLTIRYINYIIIKFILIGAKKLPSFTSMYCIVFIRRNITFSGIHNLEKTIVNVPRVQNYGKNV